MIAQQKKESDINKDKELDIRDIVEDPFIKNYSKYIEYRKKNGWIRENIKIHEDLNSIVSTNRLKTGNEGIVIDIKCPPGIIISIIGKNSLYPIENIHPFELKFANSDNIEIDANTNIRIFKDTIFKKRKKICDILYRDIDMLNHSNSPNIFKRYDELYRFDQGIELKGDDHLRICITNPNTDINIIKFNISTDLWIPKA